jgi:hydrogenase-4 component E
MEPAWILPFMHFVAMTLLVTSLALIVSPQLFSCIRFYALHSFLLVLITVGTAFYHHVYHVLISAALTLILKTIVIPQIFYRMIRRLGIRRDVETYLNIPLSLIFATLLVFISFYGVGNLRAIKPPLSQEFVSVAVATLFLGMFMMTTRKKALTQVLGLLLIENGLFLLGVTTTFGMPLLVEIGIFFDVLVGAIIMGVFVFKIRGAFEGLDMDQLTNLKG